MVDEVARVLLDKLDTVDDIEERAPRKYTPRNTLDESDAADDANERVPRDPAPRNALDESSRAQFRAYCVA